MGLVVGVMSCFSFIQENLQGFLPLGERESLDMERSACPAEQLLPQLDILIAAPLDLDQAFMGILSPPGSHLQSHKLLFCSATLCPSLPMRSPSWGGAA